MIKARPSHKGTHCDCYLTLCPDWPLALGHLQGVKQQELLQERVKVKETKRERGVERQRLVGYCMCAYVQGTLALSYFYSILLTNYFYCAICLVMKIPLFISSVICSSDVLLYTSARNLPHRNQVCNTLTFQSVCADPLSLQLLKSKGATRPFPHQRSWLVKAWNTHCDPQGRTLVFPGTWVFAQHCLKGESVAN